MSDPFERANNAVISESGLFLELAATATSTPTAAPTLATDGVSLQGAARCLVSVDGGTDMDAVIWFYVVHGANVVGWRKANNGTLTVPTAGGVTERFNCSGMSRVYVQASTANTSDFHVARSVL